MNNRSKYLLKNVGILTISSFASKILVFLLVPLYTTILNTDEVGIYDLVVSTVTLLYPILTANIVDAVMRFTMDKAKSKDEIVSIAIRFILLSLIIGGLILICLRSFVIFPQLNGYEVLVFLYFSFYVIYQLLLQFAKGIEHVSDMGIAGVISTAVMLGGNILFLCVFQLRLTGFFLANVLALFFPVVYLFFRLRFWNYLKHQKILNKPLQKEMLLYCTPLIATTLGWWINSTSNKYIIAFMVSVGASGLLSVAYKIPQIINTLQGIFIQAWQISAIKEYGGDDTSLFYGQAFCFINFLMCMACSGLIILTKPIGYVLYHKEFFVAWQYVPFLLVSCVINSASSFLGPILAAKMDSKSMAMSAVYGASANIATSIALVYLLGIQGATIASILSSFIIYAIRKQSVGSEITIKNHFTVLLAWSLLCVQAVFEIYTPFWWIEFLIMGIIILFNRSQIQKTLRINI